MENFKKTILIIDDDDAIREFLEILLKKEGFKTEAVENGKVARELLKTMKPDLIILDLMLPGYGGFEILRELQMDDETEKIPVIIITGKYLDRTTAEMIKMEPNVFDFLEKPIKNEVLISLIYKALKINKN
jgi:DNA-binding response OmpR family regulator